MFEGEQEVLCDGKNKSNKDKYPTNIHINNEKYLLAERNITQRFLSLLSDFFGKNLTQISVQQIFAALLTNIFWKKEI